MRDDRYNYRRSRMVEEINADPQRRTDAIRDMQSYAVFGAVPEFVDIVLRHILKQYDLANALSDARQNYRRIWDTCEILSAPNVGFELPWTNPREGCSRELFENLKTQCEDASDHLRRVLDQIKEVVSREVGDLD